VTFDHWYTQPGFCRYLDKTLHLSYGGTLAEDDQVILKSGPQRLEQFAESLKREHRAVTQGGGKPLFKPMTISYKGGKERSYSYRATHRIANFGWQRLVINHRQPDLSDRPVFLISHRWHWQAPGITRIRRHRWPVDVYHAEGKAEGLDPYQVRDFQAVERPIGLVAVVYRLLRAAQHDLALRDNLQRQLKRDLEGSVAFWRRASRAQSLWSLALFISADLAQGESLRALMRPLLHALCAA
jgi:hypothetical protein